MVSWKRVRTGGWTFGKPVEIGPLWLGSEYRVELNLLSERDWRRGVGCRSGPF